MPNVKQVYPSWRYHPNKPQPQLCHSPEEDKLMAKEGWYDTPAKFPSEAEAVADPGPSLEEKLLERIEQLEALAESEKKTAPKKKTA